MWILFILLLFSLAMLFRAMWQRKKAVKRWRKALSLDAHSMVFHQLYAGVDGFHISRQARSGQDAFEYLYGEIEFDSFIALLSLCKPCSSTVFYDLGSGTGKAVLACAMVFNVKKSCGIEIFPSLAQCARLQKKHLEQIPEYSISARKIQFYEGNFLTTDFNDASLIFINSTAFLGETWIRISEKLEAIGPLSIVISTSKALASKQFVTLQITRVVMSWGVVNAYIQQRV